MDTSIEAITDTIEYRPLNALRTWPRNYRQGDVGAIITSILKFGFNGALRVWRNNTVMAGNHTLLALQSMQAQQMDAPRGVRVNGDSWEVACVDISHLNETQAQAFAIADNRTTELAQNDPESLANLLQELALEDTALLEATGYDGDDLDALLVELGQGVEPVADAGAQVDRAAELQEKWGTERGQVWQVGRHRIMCGDSTDADDVARLMDGAKADAVVTDPPYGMRLDASFSYSKGNAAMSIKPSTGYSNVIGDHDDYDASHIFETWGYCKEVFLFGADYYIDTIPNFGKGGSWMVWDKKNENLREVLGLADFELIWSKGKHKRRVYNILWNGALGTESEDTKARVHPTQKPSRLILRIIDEYCPGVIVDPFLGSGTTLVACEQTGRVGYGMEIDEGYTAVCLQRLSDMGLTVELLSDASE